MEHSKIKELLQDMSLEEKIGQLFQGQGSFYEAAGDRTEDVVITGPAAQMGISEQTVDNMGTILGTVGAAQLKKIQDECMRRQPHHIPSLFMADIINGYKTIFPIPLAQGAAFDPEVAKKGAEVAAAESAAAGLHITFSPMVDLVRDARWGRVMESTGEDTFLNATYAKALVEGYQGTDPGAPGKIGACVKHFAAYGAPIAGRDYNNVELSERTLRDDYLPSYQAAIKAGATLVMTSFNTLNRIPSSANKWLMRDILREEMGFDGVLISDWAAIEEIVPQGMAADRKEAARLAMEAGVDIDMMTTCYSNYLKELIEAGEVDMALLDEAVLRILKLKNKLGLFENPYKDADEATEKKLILCEAHRQTAKEAAEQTFVLLENKEMLPLKNSEKVAFIGPFCDEKLINGAWSIFGDYKDCVTVKEGIAQRNVKAVFAKGCEFLEKGKTVQGMAGSYTNTQSKKDAQAQLEEALVAAKDADKVVLCIGEHSGQTGEAASQGKILIPKPQMKLLEEVAKVNSNLTVVLFTGRPLDLRKVKKLAKAILVVWMPGTEGGNAIADVLYGEASPSGKLPMSFPYCVGQVPVFYNEFHTGRQYDPSQDGNKFQSRYTDIPNTPLYPFGYGLTYSSFTCSQVKLSSDTLQPNGQLQATVTLQNTGKRKASEVVQLYIRDDKGSVVRPVRELRGFKKIELEAGESKDVTFTITEELLKFHDIHMEYVAEPGTFTVFAGTDSTTQNQAVFTLK